MNKQEIIAEVKKCKVMVINSDDYFGQIETVEGKTSVSKAVKAREYLEDTVKSWVKKNHLGKLESFDVSGGNNSFITKDLDEEQLMEVDAIVANAVHKMTYAVKNLEAESF